MNPVEAKYLIEYMGDTQHFSKWEQSFMASITEQIEEGRYLTPKQSEVLQKLYRKSQGG